MSNLVAQMTGRSPVREDMPVPVGVPRSVSRRERDNKRNRALQRRTAAAILGLGEAVDTEEEDEDESIIPDDAQELTDIAGPSGLRINQKAVDKDKEAPEPDYPLGAPGSGEDEMLSPRAALVAPDVTPQAMEPIDASEVPRGKEQDQVPRFVPSQSASNQQINPMDVLLGRTSTRPSRPEPEPENAVTAESAQAAINTLLSGGAGGEALLKAKTPMPDPVPSDASKIMEAFDKYGPKRNWGF